MPLRKADAASLVMAVYKNTAPKDLILDLGVSP